MHTYNNEKSLYWSDLSDQDENGQNCDLTGVDTTSNCAISLTIYYNVTIKCLHKLWINSITIFNRL